jgi:hypothetical protein
VCPVSKELATVSNPPVLMLCGHLIAHDTMLSIVAASRYHKFKCPTCPQEQTPEDCVIVIL